MIWVSFDKLKIIAKSISCEKSYEKSVCLAVGANEMIMKKEIGFFYKSV